MIEYKLNIGDLRVSQHEAVTFTCLGLGSCIGLFLQDRSLGIAGGAHILLPEDIHFGGDGKCYSASSAVSALIQQFKARGSSCTGLRAKIAGGASVALAGAETGKRNTEQVLQELLRNNVYIAAMDVGGNKARSVRFHSETGTLQVRLPETNECKIY